MTNPWSTNSRDKYCIESGQAEYPWKRRTTPLMVADSGKVILGTQFRWYFSSLTAIGQYSSFSQIEEGSSQSMILWGYFNAVANAAVTQTVNNEKATI